MILRALSSVLVAMVVATPVAAQGVDISVGSIRNGIVADFIRTGSAAANNVHLSAAVLWRGSGDWSSIDRGSEAIAQARLDSVRAESQRRGALSGGMVTATANAWVDYEPRSKSVRVLGQSYPIGQGDSTKVVLVDRVDHVGGEPTISVISVGCPAEPASSMRPGARADQALVMRKAMDRWTDCVERDPRVAAFVNRAATR